MPARSVSGEPCALQAGTETAYGDAAVPLLSLRRTRSRAQALDLTSVPGHGHVVVMGVSGSGKTSVGRALAHRLGARFVDADDHHPQENKAKMAAGIALQDADREPWLRVLADVLSAASARGERLVLACSALKRGYRNTLRALGGPPLRFVYLEVPRPLLARRLEDRPGHFFAPGLLDSQLAALEVPTAEEALAIRVSEHEAVKALAERVARALEEPEPCRPGPGTLEP